MDAACSCKKNICYAPAQMFSVGSLPAPLAVNTWLNQHQGRSEQHAAYSEEFAHLVVLFSKNSVERSTAPAIAAHKSPMPMTAVDASGFDGNCMRMDTHSEHISRQ